MIKFDLKTSIENEIRAMQYLSSPGHPSVVPLLGVFTCQNDPQRWYMVVPYYPGGDLLDMTNGYIKKRSQIPEEKLKQTFASILSALEYCHSKGVAHMDISPEQIWYDASGQAFLGDFESLRVDLVGDTTIKCPRIYGKPCFMAPEMLYLQPLNPFAIDIFSLGATMFTAATNKFLLEHLGNNDRKALMRRSSFQLLVSSDEGSARLVQRVAKGKQTSPQLLDLLSMMTRCNFKQRPSIVDIKCHAWFKEVKCDNSQ